jgi:hypothetical protein
MNIRPQRTLTHPSLESSGFFLLLFHPPPNSPKWPQPHNRTTDTEAGLGVWVGRGMRIKVRCRSLHGMKALATALAQTSKLGDLILLSGSVCFPYSSAILHSQLIEILVQEKQHLRRIIYELWSKILI